MRTLKYWLMWAFVPILLCGFTARASTTYDPYAIRDATRTSENTVLMLEGSKYFYQFQVELEKNTTFGFGHLLRAVETHSLVTQLCGTCRLETAGIKNGESIYHRRVRPEEPVAYLGDTPVFLPACGNPVRHVPEPVAVQPAQPPPPPQVPPPPPRNERPEGCSEDNVSYTTSYWEHPSLYGFPYGYLGGVGGGGFPWTTSHHYWTCIQQPPETDKEGSP